MRIGAVTTSYRDEETIRGTLACLNPFVDKHIVFIQDKPFYGERIEPDKTEDICNEFDKVEVLKGFHEEHQLRNLGMDILSDCDWVIGFDADEMMTKDSLEKLIKHLETTKANAVGFVCKVYWKNTDYIFSPDPEHIKVCVTRSNAGVRYTDKQVINSSCNVIDYKEKPYITHHHLSYCAPKNIYRKVMHYNHANEFNGQEWYDKHYKNWKPGEPVYQPFGTKWEAKFSPLPEELRKLL